MRFDLNLACRDLNVRKKERKKEKKKNKADTEDCPARMAPVKALVVEIKKEPKTKQQQQHLQQQQQYHHQRNNNR